MAVPQLRNFGFVLLALQMLPEVRLLLSSTVAHGAVELSTRSHTHGQVPGDTLPRSGVVVRPWRGKKGGTSSYVLGFNKQQQQLTFSPFAVFHTLSIMNEPH